MTRLYHEYLVDMYVKIEESRLNWTKNNQRTIRAEIYSGVVDMIESGSDSLNDVGSKIILPATFVGSPRHLQNLYQNAMSMMHHFGKPTFFDFHLQSKMERYNRKCAEVLHGK